MDPLLQKFIRCIWKDKVYKFQALPFGLWNVAPRVFTKLLRPVAAFLIKQGIRLVLYLDDMLIIGSKYQDRMSVVHKTIYGPSHWFGLQRPQREVNNNSNSNNYLPQVHHQPELHDATFTSRKRAENSYTLPTNSYVRRCISPHASSATECPRVSSTSGVESLSSFSTTSSTTNQGFAKKQIQVRKQNASNDRTIEHRQDRSKMVVNELTSSKRKSDSATNSRYNNLHRRIQNGLWCAFLRRENERQMVSPRENVAHKRVRTQGGSVSNSRVAKEPAPNSSHSEHGQLNSRLIHQPQGRNTLHGTCTTAILQLWDWCMLRDMYLITQHVPGKTNTLADGKSREFRDETDWKIRPQRNPTISVGMQDRPFCHQID